MIPKYAFRVQVVWKGVEGLVREEHSFDLLPAAMEYRLKALGKPRTRSVIVMSVIDETVRTKFDAA